MMKILFQLLLWFLCLVGLVIVGLWMLVCAFNPRSSKFFSLAIGVDNAVSATFGGDGFTTISHRAGVAMKNGKRWGCILCRFLDKIQTDHCERS